MDMLFELPIELPPPPERPSTQAIYQLLKQAILTGHLGPGTKLPPTRSAGTYFRLSRNPMVSVYERLANDGLVSSRRGAGTFVMPLKAQNLTQSRPAADEKVHASDFINPRWADQSLSRNIKFWSENLLPNEVANQIELRPSLVDMSQFPFAEFRRCMAKALRRMERLPPIRWGPQPNQGNARLRQAIVEHVTVMRALACSADDVIVTSGAQQAFDLIARVFVETGRTLVAVEEPCYPPLVAAFTAAGASICRIPVDQEGIIVEAIPAAAKLVCVSPSNQFPLGVTMSADRRRQLGEFAKSQRCLIVEDDYDGEFRSDGEPLKAIHSHGVSDFVLYVGTFSKCMFPSLRLGYMIVPDWAVEPLALARNCSDWHTSSVIERATATFINEGQLSSHVARMRSIYRDRRRSLLSVLASEFGKSLSPLSSSYGLHLTALGDNAINWDAIALKAQSNGVQIHTLTRYYDGTPKAGLVFGLAAEPEDRLRLAVQKLRDLL